MAADHWQAWLDEPLPALNGQTPRQAAQTKEGRERLEALFLHFERLSSDDNNPAMHPPIEVLRAQLFCR